MAMNFSNVFGNLHRLDYREILLFQKSLLKPAFRAVFILHELELFWYLLYKLQSLFKNKTQTFLVFPNIVSLTPLLATFLLHHCVTNPLRPVLPISLPSEIFLLN